MERYYTLVSSYSDTFTLEEQRELFVKRLKNTLKTTIAGCLQGYMIPGLEKLKKRRLIELLYDILKNTLDISMSHADARAIEACQKLYRRRRYMSKKVPENLEDPFTFDTIDEIPQELRYGYVDTRGHYYVFNVAELEFFIRQEGCWNPYTKQKIPDDDVFNMYEHMRKNRIDKKKEVKWQNSMHALTDMSIAMETKGFYNDVEWLKKLSYIKCLKTIGIYKDMTNDNDYFCGIRLNRKDYIFDFCRETIRLFKNSDRHYLFCCNFIKALAMNLEDLYVNLPEWLLSIESQSTYLNNNNGMIIGYMQNIMSNIDENYILHSIINNIEGSHTDDNYI